MFWRNLFQIALEQEFLLLFLQERLSAQQIMRRGIMELQNN